MGAAVRHDLDRHDLIMLNGREGPIVLHVLSDEADLSEIAYLITHAHL